MINHTFTLTLLSSHASFTLLKNSCPIWSIRILAPYDQFRDPMKDFLQQIKSDKKSIITFENVHINIYTSPIYDATIRIQPTTDKKSYDLMQISTDKDKCEFYLFQTVMAKDETCFTSSSTVLAAPVIPGLQVLTSFALHINSSVE